MWCAAPFPPLWVASWLVSKFTRRSLATTHFCWPVETPSSLWRSVLPLLLCLSPGLGAHLYAIGKGGNLQDSVPGSHGGAGGIHRASVAGAVRGPGTGKQLDYWFRRGGHPLDGFGQRFLGAGGAAISGKTSGYDVVLCWRGWPASTNPV